VFKRDQACCGCLFKCCTNGGCCGGGCCRCCTSQLYTIHQQPVFRSVFDQDPVAYFRYSSRLRPPCCCFSEIISTAVEQVQPLSELEVLQLSQFLTHLSGEHTCTFGICTQLYFYAYAPLPSGYPGPDAFNNITTMLMTEEQARGFIGVMS